MNILYESVGFQEWGIFLFVVFSLMAFNELARVKKWAGIALFIIVPIILTIFVWPHTCAMGNKYGTGNWFNWAKTYSALAGCIGFMVIRYIPAAAKKKWLLCFPPLILAINILEAVFRDFQVFSYHSSGEMINHLWLMSGPWNIMNGIAGLLNIVTICGWFGIFVSKDKSKDMIWPDMIWPWIIAYDLWNYAYVYNCIPDKSFFTGLALLISCTIPAFFIKKGAWLQHRAHTLAFWAMFSLTCPQFSAVLVPVKTTHNPKAFFVISLIALLSNIAVAVYEFMIIRKRKVNPIKGEVYTETKAYKQVVEDNI